jgi:nicotinamide mononucleotide adenylyltransferase/SAM-dependent methyltransferase
MNALLIGRFHALTRSQWDWLATFAQQPIDRVICVITSADHHDTRRNPLAAQTRERLLRPALERTGKPVEFAQVADVPESEGWVSYVVAHLQHRIDPANTVVHSANHDVQALFTQAGFRVVAPAMLGPSPSELVAQIAARAPGWQREASPETIAIYGEPGRVEALAALFTEHLVNDDGELGHARDFTSYGAQMDASLKQKLDDLLPWVKPGCIVDKGCGTGKLLVELSHRYPSSRLVGVDLSREFLRRCDENTYAGQDVGFVHANVIDRNVPPGSASTVIYSSVMHEVHSYTGYDQTQIDRALGNAFTELAPGGRVIIRDGVSPEPATWRLTLLDAQTRDTFARFAREFRHGRGVQFEQLTPDVVRLSSHDANEFLCKKDYLTNWHIEVHEEFGVLTLAQWRAALTRAGFEPAHLHEYVNEWIAEHRYRGHVIVSDDAGAPLPWPATNAVVVGARPT